MREMKFAGMLALAAALLSPNAAAEAAERGAKMQLVYEQHGNVGVVRYRPQPCPPGDRGTPSARSAGVEPAPGDPAGPADASAAEPRRRGHVIRYRPAGPSELFAESPGFVIEAPGFRIVR